jgi:VWFA-related protein
MNKTIYRKGSLLLSAALFAATFAPLSTRAASNEANNASATGDPSAVVMTITATAKKDAQPPAITRNDLALYQGKERVQVADFKRGDTLYLAILIDDSLRGSIANQWSDLRAFMNAQPSTTYIAVAYARNGVAMVAQDFTTDHALAAKALRLPIGSLTVANSPYLAMQDWIKRWPEQAQGQRNSILLFSSGIDYFRGGFAPQDPDLDTTIARAQKANINVWSIYVPDGGAGRGRRGFSAFNWESNLSKISQETGGENYFLGLQMPVDLRPYLDSIQAHLNNQYLLAFTGDGGHKGKYETVKVTSELHNVGFLTPSQVFLPAAR